MRPFAVSTATTCCCRSLLNLVNNFFENYSLTFAGWRIVITLTLLVIRQMPSSTRRPNIVPRFIDLSRRRRCLRLRLLAFRHEHAFVLIQAWLGQPTMCGTSRSDTSVQLPAFFHIHILAVPVFICVICANIFQFVLRHKSVISRANESRRSMCH